MDNRIKKAINTIELTEEQKNRIFDVISRRSSRYGEEIQMTDKKKRLFKKPLRVALIAAVIGCMLIATAFAEEIGGYFSGMLTKDPIVSESVATGVFSDTDGHVEMSVEELLTDRSVIRAVVRYSALDDAGKEWLAQLNETAASGRSLMVWPDRLTSGGYAASELIEYRTDDQAFYCLTACCMSRDTGSVKLVYPMTAEGRETTLDIIKTIDTEVWRINPEPVVFTYEGCPYYPTEVEISPLSISVCGKQEGIAYFEKYETGWGAYSLTDYSDKLVASLYLVRADGTKLELTGGSSGLRLQSYYDEFEPEDFIFFHNTFNEPVDISEFTGIEFNGEYFPFDK